MKYSISSAQIDDFCKFVTDYLNNFRDNEQYSYEILEKDIISNRPYVKVRFVCKKKSDQRVSVCDILFNEYSVSSKWCYTNFGIDFARLYLRYMASIYGEEYLDDALTQKEETVANIIAGARRELKHVIKTRRSSCQN